MHYVLTHIASTNRTSTSTKIWNSQSTGTCLVTTETSFVCHCGCRAMMAWASTAGPKPQQPIAPISLDFPCLRRKSSERLVETSVARFQIPWQERTCRSWIVQYKTCP